ncbi:MAG: nucleotidyltransferase family protein [Chloroflexi bacterium]|nr:nucleotidyltransferase family protein [Chloroflexota bacterium]
MRRDEVLSIIRAHWSELQEMGVLSLSLFGSVARAEAGPDSDVDILVEVRRPMGFFRFFAIQEYLEQLLGRKVDLVTPSGLRPEMRDQILREAVRAA